MLKAVQSKGVQPTLSRLIAPIEEGALASVFDNEEKGGISEF